MKMVKEKCKRVNSGYYEVYDRYGYLKAIIRKRKPIYGKAWEISTHSYVQYRSTKRECLEMISYNK